MRISWPIFTGEFFELFRPAALVGSVLLSGWVLASARRWRLHFIAVAAWTVGTFFFPFVVLPIYLVVRNAAPPRRLPTALEDASPVAPVRFRLAIPLVYLAVALSLICVYLYRDHRSIDARLAHAAQAKVMNNRERAIREYQEALMLEDNPHTHKLLGIELAQQGNWVEALNEFRAAEVGGEPDELINFRMGQALDRLNRNAEAAGEYNAFLASAHCQQPLPDSSCEHAKRAIEAMKSSPAR